jgi:CheY-like chemotaxis protein
MADVRPILVVDDDQYVRDFLRHALIEEGYTVIVAADGQEALEIAREEKLSLIILDMRMPIADGWTFLQEYCDDPLPHAPIITTSAEKGNLRMLMCANEFIPKPYDLSELLDCINKYARPERYFSSSRT